MNRDPSDSESDSETTDRSPSDPTASDDVYGENEADEPRMVSESGSNESPARREEAFAVVDPKAYGLLLLIGAVLLLIPEPITSTVGLILIATAVFLAAIDFFSPSGGVA